MSEARDGARILVVGGRGFVGSHVVRALIARGYRVHVFGPDMADRPVARRPLPPRRNDRQHRGHGGARRRHGRRPAGRHRLMRGLWRGQCRADAVGRGGCGSRVRRERRWLQAPDRQLRPGMACARIVWTSSTVVYGPADAYGDVRVDERSAKAPRHGLRPHQACRRGSRDLPRPAASDRDRGLEASARARPRALVPGRRGGADRVVARGQERRGPHDRLPRSCRWTSCTWRIRRAPWLRRSKPQPSRLPIYNINGFTASRERSRADDRGAATGAADHPRGPAGRHAVSADLRCGVPAGVRFCTRLRSNRLRRRLCSPKPQDRHRCMRSASSSLV